MLGITAGGPMGPAHTPATEDARPPAHPVAAPDADPRPLGRADREAWAVLASVPGIGPVTLATVVELMGGARAAIDGACVDGGRAVADAAATSGDPRAAALLTPDVTAAIADQAARSTPVLAALARLEIRIMLLDDPDYPDRLLGIEMPPPVLFVRGDADALASPHAVAIVGTRAASEAGRALAMHLSSGISAQGATVVSGLAVGIDGAAHAAAVDLGRPTVAVLGGGHDRLFPHAHRGLADAIVAEGGAVVSEMAPLERPTRWSFPRRNRILSGLADATVVVEAPLRSGAIGTARWAIEQGRACFVVTGRPGDRPTEGCLGLLREHPGLARVVTTLPELLEDLGLAGDPRPTRRPGRRPLRLDALGLSSVEHRIAEGLRHGGQTLDEIVRAAGVPVATALSALTMLETRGLVGAAYGRYRPTAALAGAVTRRARR